MERYADDTIEGMEKEKEQLLQLVGFMIGKEHFGVNILMVQEIIRSAFITTVPNAPEFIEGVINLRGNIIPVIDLRKRLNLKKDDDVKEGNTRILIINVSGRVTGFVVDAVSKVLKILASTIKPPPDIVVAGLKSKYIEGVCEIDNKLVILLDFNKILQIKEMANLKKFGEDAVA